MDGLAVFYKYLERNYCILEIIFFKKFMFYCFWREISGFLEKSICCFILSFFLWILEVDSIYSLIDCFFLFWFIFVIKYSIVWRVE